MELHESAPDNVVAQPTEPSSRSRREGLRVPPDDLDEQKLAQARQRGLRPRPRGRRFPEREPEELLDRGVVGRA